MNVPLMMRATSRRFIWQPEACQRHAQSHINQARMQANQSSIVAIFRYSLLHESNFHGHSRPRERDDYELHLQLGKREHPDSHLHFLTVIGALHVIAMFHIDGNADPNRKIFSKQTRNQSHVSIRLGQELSPISF